MGRRAHKAYKSFTWKFWIEELIKHKIFGRLVLDIEKLLGTIIEDEINVLDINKTNWEFLR